MGYIIDFSKYLSKDDCISLDARIMNVHVIQAIEQINQQLKLISQTSSVHEQGTDLFYQLVLSIQKFLTYHDAELHTCAQLKFEILNLLNKIKKLNHGVENLSSFILSSIYEQMISKYLRLPTKEMLHDLMTYETYVHLGVIKELEVHDKLMTEKIRDLDTYSLLIADYKKPNIEADLLEQYFQENRKVFLDRLIQSENKIKHIHYDFEFLKYFCNLKKIFNLIDRDVQHYLNQKIKHELFSNN